MRLSRLARRNRLALRAVSAAGILLAALFAGCGKGHFKTAPVTGRVTHQGKPVNGGSLTFSPINTGEGSNAGKPASGTVMADGTYVLGTYGKSDGAVVARHKVSYRPPSVETKMEEVDGSMRPVEPRPVPPYAGLVPAKKEYEVTSGKNQIDIELVPGEKSR